MKPASASTSAAAASQPFSIPHFGAYRAYLLLERRLSPLTASAYLTDLATFFGFANPAGDFDLGALAPPLLRAYVKNLTAVGFAPSSISRHLSALKSYSGFLVEEGILKTDPGEGFSGPQSQRYKPSSLSRAEMDSLYDRLHDAVVKEEKAARRNLALVELLYGGGLRISEAIGLKLDHLRLTEGLLLVEGKGRKQRLVPVGRKVVHSLEAYLELERSLLPQAAGRPRPGNVLLNPRGLPLSRMGAWKILQNLRLESGVGTAFSPHTFRHTFATHLIEAGANLRAVQEMLGHADISTTQIYTHLDSHYLNEVHRSFHPRNR